MKNQPPKTTAQSAFTLIEMLVVIAIIGILAGLITGVAASVVNKAKLKRVQTDLHQIESGIEAYKGRKGFYPQDNPISSASLTTAGCGQTNPLYYELTGMKYFPANGTYSNLIPTDLNQIASNDLAAYCHVTGIANSATTTSASDDAAAPESFLKTFAPKQVQTNQDNTITKNLEFLVAPLSDDNDNDYNQWHYNSSHPKYNTDSYDLWAIVKIGAKTNKICNWSDSPIIVTSPTQLY